MIYAILSLIVQPPTAFIVTSSPRTPEYREVTTRQACLPHIFEFFYRNSYGLDRRVEVLHVLADGVEISGAASALQARAADRSIESIGLLDCGEDDQSTDLRAYMGLSPLESTARGMEPHVVFRVKEIDGQWQLEF